MLNTLSGTDQKTISGIGRPGTGTFNVDAKAVATEKLDRTVPLTMPWDETFDIGMDTDTPVSDRDYQVPFRFPGKIIGLTVSVEPPPLASDDDKKLREGMRQAADHG